MTRLQTSWRDFIDTLITSMLFLTGFFSCLETNQWYEVIMCAGISCFLPVLFVSVCAYLFCCVWSLSQSLQVHPSVRILYSHLFTSSFFSGNESSQRKAPATNAHEQTHTHKHSIYSQLPTHLHKIVCPQCFWDTAFLPISLCFLVLIFALLVASFR